MYNINYIKIFLLQIEILTVLYATRSFRNSTGTENDLKNIIYMIFFKQPTTFGLRRSRIIFITRVFHNVDHFEMYMNRCSTRRQSTGTSLTEQNISVKNLKTQLDSTLLSLLYQFLTNLAKLLERGLFTEA